ncbi:hypothetical protein BH11PLA1_BH11PLA1_16910 [soil metagenome]
MKASIVMSLVTVVGLASSASAQYTFEARLVFDSDPLLAISGINYGTRALLPGPLATRVGITLMARVTSNGTTPNYGVAAMSGGGSSAMPNSRFSHNDAFANGNGVPNFQRGYVGETGANVGLMRYSAPAFASDGSAQLVDFRIFMNGVNTGANTPTGNLPQQIAPTDSPYFSGSRSQNAYIESLTRDSLVGMTAQRGPLPDVDGTNPFVNYADSGRDADLDLAGNQSAWYAIYHLVFLPAPTSAAVTVSFDGSFRAGTNSVLSPNGWVMTTSPLTRGTATVLLLVPSPGSSFAVGALGALSMRRSRRHR